MKNSWIKKERETLPLICMVQREGMFCCWVHIHREAHLNNWTSSNGSYLGFCYVFLWLRWSIWRGSFSRSPVCFLFHSLPLRFLSLCVSACVYAYVSFCFVPPLSRSIRFELCQLPVKFFLRLTVACVQKFRGKGIKKPVRNHS